MEEFGIKATGVEEMEDNAALYTIQVVLHLSEILNSTRDVE